MMGLHGEEFTNSSDVAFLRALHATHKPWPGVLPGLALGIPDLGPGTCFLPGPFPAGLATAVSSCARRQSLGAFAWLTSNGGPQTD